jgi:hypothetical protein
MEDPMPLFTSPTFRKKNGRPHDLWFTGVTVAKTVVKHNGSWKTLTAPTEEFLAECSVVLRGGYVHQISDSLASELTGAGYGAYITS